MDFPYAFLNTSELIPATPQVEGNTVLRDMTEFLHLEQTESSHGVDYPRHKNQIAIAYLCLLEAIASGDRAQINQICESNLYTAFSEGLEDLNYST